MAVKPSQLNTKTAKYTVRKRGDKFILVDKQIIRWRKRRKEQLKEEKAAADPEETTELNWKLFE